jgi:hypothetical protein
MKRDPRLILFIIHLLFEGNICQIGLAVYGKQLVEDIEYRQDQVKKVGLGFELPPSLFGLRGLQIVENIAAA